MNTQHYTASFTVDQSPEVSGPGTLTRSITACRKDGRAYRTDRRLDWLCGRGVDPGPVYELDSYQRDLHWQQSRSRGYDPGDNGQSFDACYRPPFSA
jgi:hypothetical protein